MVAIAWLLARDTETDESPPQGIDIRYPNANPLVGLAVGAGPISGITVDPKLASTHAKFCVSRLTVDIAETAYFVESGVAYQPVNHLARAQSVRGEAAVDDRRGRAVSGRASHRAVAAHRFRLLAL